MNWKDFLNKITAGTQFPKKSQLLLLLLAGILLLVIVLPVPDGKQGNTEEETENIRQKNSGSSAQDYQEYLERRLSKALQYVEGVGRTEIVITMKSSAEQVVEKDQDTSSQMTAEEDSGGGKRTIEERSSQKSSVYTQQSDGSSNPYIKKELMPEVEGVLVIADGGNNAVVVKDITEAVQALFGVEAHKIKIMKRTDT